MFQINEKNISVSLIELKNTINDETINTLIAEIGKIEKKCKDCTLLFIDAGAVASMNHLKACILFSLKSFSTKTNLAKKLGAEILLYLSGYRQISRAIENVGINKKTKTLLFLKVFSLKSDEKYFKDEIISKVLQNKIKKIETDVKSIPLYNEDKLKNNLNISDAEVELYLKSNENTDRQTVLEKFAIEKSALLNLLK